MNALNTAANVTATDLMTASIKWLLTNTEGNFEVHALQDRAWLELAAQAVVPGAGNNAPWLRLQVPLDHPALEGWIWEALLPVPGYDPETAEEWEESYAWKCVSMHEMVYGNHDGFVTPKR